MALLTKAEEKSQKKNERSNILLSTERSLKAWVYNMFCIMPAKTTQTVFGKENEVFPMGRGGVERSLELRITLKT